MRAEHITGLFVKFGQQLLRCDAFWELRNLSKLAIFILELQYWEGDRRNPIPISKKDMASWLKCSERSAMTVLQDLEDWGFIVRDERGSLRGPRAERATIYRMDWRATNHGTSPGYGYLKYKRPTRCTLLQYH